MKIMCKNMTHALKANKLLYNCGVFSKVEKDADNPDVNGCVYCIIFDDKESVKALECMCKGGVILHKKEKQKYAGDCV